MQKDREKRQPEQEPRGADIIAGRNAVSEALRAGRTIDSLYIQRGERSGALSALVAKAKAHYEAQGHRASGIKSFSLYVKPEQGKPYYLVNAKTTPDIDL